MCSLPGLPAPGAEVHVIITRVNPNPDYGFVELWVNMNDERKPIYEKMTKDIQIYKKKFDGLEGKPGDLCLVCVCDIWHRARIVSIEGETYTVFLIDQGDTHKTTNDALAWCQCDSFLLPPEIESCILANVLYIEKDLPEKTVGFFNSLCGKKLKGLVQHVLVSAKVILLRIPIISTSLCKAGVAKKIPIDEFNYLAEKNLRPARDDHSEADDVEPEQSLDVGCKLDEYLYPELLDDTFEIVIVTAVTNPRNIFCKLNILSKAVKLLTEQMQKHYEDCADLEKVQLLTCGSPCAARGINGRWHRSLLKQNLVDDGTVEVFHVDEGETELVPVENIKPLHWKFLRMPVFTYPCLLKGVEDEGTGWTSGQIDHFKSLLLHQTFVAKFDPHKTLKGIYWVSLYSQSNSTFINTSFMENAELMSFNDEIKQAEFNVNTHALQELSLPCTKNQAIDTGEDLPISDRDDIPVSSGSASSNPLIQMDVMSEGVELNMMAPETAVQDLSQVQHDQVSKDASSPNKAPLLQEGNGSIDLCAADELSMSSQSIRDVSAPEPQHEKNNLDSGGQPTPETFLHSKSLPAKGNMRTTYQWSSISFNKAEDVYASCIVGPHYFWCQYSNTEELNKISSLSQEAGEAEAMFLESLGLGSPCLALFAADNQWYRAQVIRIVDDTFHVLFIDYGNESDVESKNVKPLPQSLLEKAPRALLCSLNGFNESEGSWTDSVYDDFYTLLVDKPLKVTVLNEEDHTEAMVPQYTVQVECGNAIVNDAVLKYWKPVATEHVTTRMLETENSAQIPAKSKMPNASMYKKAKLSKNKKEDVYASSIVSPNYFWCQYANPEELTQVSKLCQEAGEAQLDKMFLKTLGPGSPCLALFATDNQWYRAQVIRTADDTFHVLFIDYGNECDVESKSVKPLPQSLLEKAPQAFLCSLNGFNESEGSWTDSVYDDFYNLLVDRPLTLAAINKINHSELSVPQYVVEIDCEGVDVNAAVLKYWEPAAKNPV